jgi:hypothetical protein
MSSMAEQSISRQGLDTSFDEEEIRKSNLLLEAKLLRAQRRHDEAASRLADAAEIEEHLGEICEAKGLLEKSWVHRISAVGAWAMAGNIHQAIILGEALLARPELPKRLQQHVQPYVESLRQRRAQWSEALELAGTNEGRY